MSFAVLDLTLLDEAVLSAQSASFGGHGSLDYIPGATLLGWAANKLYATLRRQGDEFTVFHSGRVRFGNGRPVNDDGITGWPMPLCWMHEKLCEPISKTITHQGRSHLEPRQLHNTLCADAQSLLHNPRTLKSGYVVPDTGEYLCPSHHLRMRTAIHPDTARAATGQLFGYQALVSGQRFRATLAADESVAEDLFDEVCNAFDNVTLYLGRSRSAQYGRVHCQCQRPPTTQCEPKADDNRTLTLWLLSDIAATDATGQPTFEPNLAWLADGLPEARLLCERSAIDTRRYSPYNGYRRTPDVERHVIRQGSILSYALDKPLSPAQMAIFDTGLGLYRECGLGVVAVNPPLLALRQPDWPLPANSSPPVEHNQNPSPTQPDHPLARWLLRQQSQPASQAVNEIRTLKEGLKNAYLTAAQYAGIRAGTNWIGPGPSQWGRVLEATRVHRGDPEALRHALFNEVNGICVDKHGETWGVPTVNYEVEGSPVTTFRHWFENTILPAHRDGGTAWTARVAELARLGREHTQRGKLS